MYFFFFNDTATTEIYTLSLHDALPIFNVSRPPTVTWSGRGRSGRLRDRWFQATGGPRLSGRRQPHRVHGGRARQTADRRSEEHTPEIPSRQKLVCPLLLLKKKKKYIQI